MSVEQEVKPGVAIKQVEKRNWKREISNKTADIVSRFIGPVIRHWAKNVGEATEIEYPQMLDAKIYEALRDNCVVVLVSNHSSQYDAMVLALATEDMTERFANPADPQEFPEPVQAQVELPLAKSMVDGAQGFKAAITYKSTASVLEGHGMEIVPTATRKDQDKRGLPKNAREFIHHISEAIAKGPVIIANLASSNVDEGRIGPDGKINGMQPFEEDVLELYYRIAQKHHKHVAFVPVSIRGSREVLNPDTRLPGLKATMAGFGFGDPVMVSAFIDIPLRTDQSPLKELIDACNWQGIEKILGTTIASHLPQEQQGVFAVKEPTTLWASGLSLKV